MTLGARGGIEDELAELKREQWRLETLAELEALKASLGDASDAAEGGASSSSGTNLEHEALIAALRAKLDAAMPAGGVDVEGNTGGAGLAGGAAADVDSLDDVDDLDAEIAAMEAKLEAARLSRDDMEAQRHALEREMDAFMRMAMEDGGNAEDVLGALGSLGGTLGGSGSLLSLTKEPREEIDP